jgi:hypothetical protein
MLKQAHKLLKNNSLTYKWGYFKLWFMVNILGKYDCYVFYTNSKTVDAVFLSRIKENELYIEEFYINLKASSIDRLPLILKIYFESFKLKDIRSILIQVKPFQEGLTKFLTSAFGEELSFKRSTFRQLSERMKSQSNYDTIILIREI